MGADKGSCAVPWEGMVLPSPGKSLDWQTVRTSPSKKAGVEEEAEEKRIKDHWLLGGWDWNVIFSFD